MEKTTTEYKLIKRVNGGDVLNDVTVSTWDCIEDALQAIQDEWNNRVCYLCPDQIDEWNYISEDGRALNWDNYSISIVEVDENPEKINI